jgi:hypothetical protein
MGNESRIENQAHDEDEKEHGLSSVGEILASCIEQIVDGSSFDFPLA